MQIGCIVRFLSTVKADTIVGNIEVSSDTHACDDASQVLKMLMAITEIGHGRNDIIFEVLECSTFENHVRRHLHVYFVVRCAHRHVSKFGGVEHFVFIFIFIFISLLSGKCCKGKQQIKNLIASKLRRISKFQ